MRWTVITSASARRCVLRHCALQENDLCQFDRDGTTRFSVLIMSDQYGATLKEVQPPKR